MAPGAREKRRPPALLLATLLLLTSFSTISSTFPPSAPSANPCCTYSNIGINYGQLGNNLPTPQRVRELVQSTTITKVKIYDTNAAIIEAFANTGIEFTVMVKNEQIHSLLDTHAAQKWVNENVACYLPATQIRTILVGNEILGNDDQINGWIVPVMQNIHSALVTLRIDNQVKVSTPHSLSVLSSSYPPSSGAFRTDLVSHVIKPMLQFLSQTGSPFMVNTYPYFAYKSSPLNITLAYALFLPNAGVVDPKTKLRYYNLMDAQVDAVYSAMAKLGFQDIGIVVSETGWPSAGDPTEFGVSVNNAMVYNRNLIAHVTSMGTPMRHGKLMDTYIFALFNENQKPGPTTERNFGLFKPDMSVVYDIGLFKGGQRYANVFPPPPPQPPAHPYPSPDEPPPAPYYHSPPLYQVPPATPAYQPPPTPVYQPPPTPAYQPPPSYQPPSGGGGGGGGGGTGPRIWCISKPGSPVGSLEAALNFACGEGGADCGSIQGSGACFQPDTLESHSSFAFNSYFHKHGRNFWNCYFNNNALLTVSDPSYGTCVYPSQ
ncbi:glucan endo-1,3-beta-glucosidase 7 [Selaginella moellendorffii]|nr:glucan endo-1,3-beta-glucosidase 7 [Selaginella moellendorffii]|eukprot:XP_002971087.2 glucan endo-1,3-beta-glucosidase 7 [Selaginella moellendorffii]